MFDFKPSAELVKRIKENIKAEAVRRKFSIPPGFESADTEWERSEISKNILSVLKMHAQRVRHEEKASFVIITNGAIVKELDDDIGTHTAIIAQGEGDALMLELAKELVAWLGDRSIVLDKGPITELRLVGESIVAFVKPLEPRPVDPGWVPSVEIE